MEVLAALLVSSLKREKRRSWRFEVGFCRFWAQSGLRRGGRAKSAAFLFDRRR